MSERVGARWTLQEYVSRVRYSRGLSEFIVESNSDRSMYSRFLNAHGREVQGVPAGRIVVEPEELERRGLTPGVKKQLLSIAASLSEAGAPESVAAIVDRDYDGLCGVTSDHVMVTDYHSAEVYAFDGRVLDRLVDGCWKVESFGGAVLIAELRGPLAWLGECRQRLSAMSVGVIDNWVRFMGTSGLPIEIRKEEIVGRSLSSGGQSRSAARIAQLVEEIDSTAGMTVSERDVMRGHDFTALLHAVFAGRWGRSQRIDVRGVSAETFEGMLRLALDPTELAEESLFESMLARWPVPQARTT